MKHKYLILTALLLLTFITKTYSQTETQYSGWLAIYHKQKITQKLGYLFDAQQTKIGKATLSNRLRFEQRFINIENGGFSQRLRYQIRSQIPLVKVDSSFKKGLYLALQNELFVNVQHRERASNSFLDQNRSYISFGYRLSKKIDTELGYQYIYSKDRGGNLRNNVFQLAVYTDF
ncbi:MAG: DUF2490 domain-containing protein [Sphingobacteriaceae bacterium]|nr:MAG: DUF2490 domain-containing protein [Sphingobacteriaceae bacterium]